jgi:hypothetical protein
VDNILQLPCTPGGNCNATQMSQFYAFEAGLKAAVLSTLVASNGTFGAFLESCFQHGVTCSDADWFLVAINGTSQADTFANWYAGNTTGHTVGVDVPWPGDDTCQANAQHGWC